jgi:hypothetical protein
MKIAGLVIGIGLFVLSLIVLVICLLLPSLTNNRVNFGEALIGIIPSIIVGFIALIITVVSAVMMLIAKKK